MLRLSQLPAMCVSFLGTLLDLGGVQHGNQLSQLLRFFFFFFFFFWEGKIFITQVQR